MRKVYILIGSQLSGKTTKMESLREDGDMVFSPDNVIENILETFNIKNYADILECIVYPKDNYFKSYYNTILNIQMNAASVYYDGNIFIDSCNMTKEQRSKWFTILSDDDNTQFIALNFHNVSLDELLIRNEIRSKTCGNGKFIPDEIIKLNYNSYEEPTKDEGFFTIINM